MYTRLDLHSLPQSLQSVHTKKPFCRKTDFFRHFSAKKSGDRIFWVTALLRSRIQLSSRMNMIRKLIVSSTHDTQIARSAQCFVSTAPMPAPTANRPITPK